MKQSKNASEFPAALKRPFLLLTVVALVFGASSGVVSAVGGQVQSRSIMMSDNAQSGTSITSGVGSGTNVTYRVSFTAATSYTMKGLILDFCAGSGGTPFIGDSTCAAPTSFTVGTTPSVDTNTSPDNLGTGWTASSLNSGQTFKMVNSTGTSITASSTYTFTISGITNPSTVGTFYARILTYPSDTVGIGSYAHGTPGAYQDYGGFALSTASAVQVTAKVQETLTFCVLGTTTPPTLTAPTSCSDVSATSPAITLGHGTNNTLDATQVDSNSVYTYSSTNALHGLTIRMHVNNACGGLSTDGGTTCAIPATNSGSATTPSSSGQALTAGTAAFGLAISSGTGMTASAPYNGSTASNYYGFDTTTSGSNVTTTFGSTAVTGTGPVNNILNTWSFAATASNTTPAGIYTANISAIATGTF